MKPFLKSIKKREKEEEEEGGRDEERGGKEGEGKVGKGEQRQINRKACGFGADMSRKKLSGCLEQFVSFILQLSLLGSVFC